MRVVASDDARGMIAERGGRLYVSVTRQRCCRSVQTLATATAVSDHQRFRSLGNEAGFELLVPQGLAKLPAELVVEARRFPRRVEAFWDGCVWVV
jgi:hypothetical protein